MEAPANHKTITEAEQQIWQLLEGIKDPEIPVISILDLGIVRGVHLEPAAAGGFRGQVIITPTYSGCPAMDMIRMSIRMALLQEGFSEVGIDTLLFPPWTTEWITERGKQQLKAFGIAPPNPKQLTCETTAFAREEAVQCPRCQSYHTMLISRFGATACKALYRCLDCQEPFDYFKCH